MELGPPRGRARLRLALGRRSPDARQGRGDPGGLDRHLAALAGATNRAKLGMIHQALLFRNPALAAKMAATLDQISGGRLIHFMDCGYMRREYVNYGLPWDDDVDTRIAKLIEATELILALWSAGEPLTHKGADLRGHRRRLQPETGSAAPPAPLVRRSDPRHPRRLRLASVRAGTPPRSRCPNCAAASVSLDAACEHAGRSLSEISAESGNPDPGRPRPRRPARATARDGRPRGGSRPESSPTRSNPSSTATRWHPTSAPSSPATATTCQAG